MMVKKTWRKRLTAFINTANRYNHASPDIVSRYCAAYRLLSNNSSFANQRVHQGKGCLNCKCKGGDAAVSCWRLAAGGWRLAVWSGSSWARKSSWWHGTEKWQAET